MDERVRLLPVDLHIHRSQLFNLNVEYMNWWLKGIEDCFKADLATLLGWSKEAVEGKKREYLTVEVENWLRTHMGSTICLNLREP